MKKSLVAATSACFAMLALIGVILSLVEKVPPESLTHAAIVVLRRRIIALAEQSRPIPRDVREIPCVPGYVCENIDGWGSALALQIVEDRVTIRSWGPDRVTSGDDIVAVFNLYNDDGTLNTDMSDWIVEPTI